SRKRFPKEGKLLKTTKGDEKVIANDIFRERVTLRAEDGEVRTLLLVDLHTELQELGQPIPAQTMLTPTHTDLVEEGALEEQETVPLAIVVDGSVGTPSADATPHVPPSPTQPQGERRPHRRRGRRG